MSTFAATENCEEPQQDISLEAIGAKSSNIVLKSQQVKCKVCKTGNVVPEVKISKDKASFFIYTRNGTLLASHETYRYLIF